MIVLKHTQSVFKSELDPITTCAVPVFFMISGWLIFSKTLNAEKLYRSAWRMFKIFIYSCIFYFIVYLIRKGHVYVPNIKDALLLFFCNNERVMGHLWYLSAYAYVLLILGGVTKYKKIKWLTYVAPITLLLYFACDLVWIAKSMEKNVSVVYCFRNFFFTGIPFVSLGALLHVKNVKTPQWLNILMVIALSALALIEIHMMKLGHIADVFFATIPLSFFIFMSFICLKNQHNNILAAWGEKYSLYIYIFHPFFCDFILRRIEGDQPDKILMIFNPLLVFFLSLLMSWAFVKIKEAIKNKLILSRSKI